MKSFIKYKDFLDEKARYYESPDFIKDDPVSIIHNFQAKNDIEISGFMTATISWGRRKSIIKCAKKIIELMDNSPYDFIINHERKALEDQLGDGALEKFDQSAKDNMTDMNNYSKILYSNFKKLL